MASAANIEKPDKEEIIAEVSARLREKEKDLRSRMAQQIASFKEKEQNMKALIKKQAKDSSRGRVTILHQSESQEKVIIGNKAEARTDNNSSFNGTPCTNLSSGSPIVSSTEPYFAMIHREEAFSRTILYADKVLRIGRGGSSLPHSRFGARRHWYISRMLHCLGKERQG